MDRRNGSDPNNFWQHYASIPWPALYGYPPYPPVAVFPNFGHTTHAPPVDSSRQQTKPQENPPSTSHTSDHPSDASSGSQGSRVSEVADSAVPQDTTQMTQSVPRRVPTALALRMLTRRLEDVIALCNGCSSQYSTEAGVLPKYLDRDEMWGKMLESRFEENEVEKHLWTNLSADVMRHMQQVDRAAGADMSVHYNDKDKRDKSEKVAHEVRLLGQRANRIVKLHQGAWTSHRNFKSMLDEVKKMKDHSLYGQECCEGKEEGAEGSKGEGDAY